MAEKRTILAVILVPEDSVYSVGDIIYTKQVQGYDFTQVKKLIDDIPSHPIPVELDATVSVKKHDPVNNPSHYTSGTIQPIDFIDDQRLGFALGNAVKYIARAGKKYPGKTKEDLQKAIWYIQRQIDRL